MRKILILLLGIAAFFGGISGLNIQASGETLRNVTYELDGGYFDISLHQQLSKGGNHAIQFLGDSTGNDQNEWVYLTSQALASTYTENSFVYYIYSDAQSTYSKPQRFSTGADGKAYGTYSATIGTGVKALNSGGLSLKDKDFEIIVHVAPVSWTTGGIVVSKFDGMNPREWIFNVGGPSSNMIFTYTMDGSTLLSAASSAIPGVVDGEDMYLKMSVDIDNGSTQHAFNFYKSTDGLNWTQVGTTVTKENVLSMYETTALVEFGGRSGFATGMFNGKIYDVQILEGLTNQKALLHMDFGNKSDNSNLFKDPYGNTFEIVNIPVTGSKNIVILNGSIPGDAISQVKNVTRFGKQTPMTPTASFINYSHNEGLDVDYTNDYLELVLMLRTKYPNTMVYGVTQNRQLDPRTTEQIAAHEIRNQQIKTLSASNNMGVVDGYAAVSAVNINSDGIHPAEAGSIQWKDAAISAINTHKFKVYTLSELVIDGTKATYYGVPKKTGYTFIGFYTDELFTQPFSTVMTNITEDTTLYAKWTPTTSGGSGSVIIDNASNFTTLDYLLMVGGVLIVIIIFTSNKKQPRGRRS